MFPVVVVSRQYPRIQSGECTKHFPYPYQEISVLNVDGYPRYRRRNTGHTDEKAGFVFDNRWVVPHNAVLVQTYNAHINVHYCASIKYLYTYTFKGHDCASLELSRPGSDSDTPSTRNEIEEHIDARYVGPAEAVWRILEFPLHGRSHSVVSLPAHLAGDKSMVFSRG